MKLLFFTQPAKKWLTFFGVLVMISHIQAQSGGNIISGALNDIEKSNQSQVFWYNGYWWGVFKNSNNKWAIWKYNSGLWSIETETNIVGQSKADVLINEATGKLYILVSKGTEQFTRLTYQGDTWIEDTGFPIFLNMNNILGNDPASIAQAPDGDLFIFFVSNDSLKTLYSNDNGVSWSSYVIRTKIDASTLTDGIGFTFNGEGQVGLFIGQGGINKKFYFFRLPDSADPSDSLNWINESLPFDPKADDHVNIIRDLDNNLYMIGKNGKSGPIFYLYKRNNNGTWEYYTIDGTNSTRPALSINEDTDSIFVCATNNDKIEYVGLNKNSLRNVNSSEWTPIIYNGSDVFNNVTLSNQILNNISGIMVCAENSTQNNLWYNNIYYPDESLPVRIQSFTAKICKEGICLTWVTQVELNVAYYVLERSEGENQFTFLANVTSNGNSNSPKIYKFIDKNIKQQKEYFYRLVEVTTSGEMIVLDTIRVFTSKILNENKLAQNFPNPFNDQTQIEYTVAKQGRVTLSILNLKGQIVEVLIDEYQLPGKYQITYSVKDLPSGIYFCKLQIGNFVEVVKMILIK